MAFVWKTYFMTFTQTLRQQMTDAVSFSLTIAIGLVICTRLKYRVATTVCSMVGNK